MRIGLDATPLLGPRTGIGTYTARLIGALSADRADRVVATAFTLRGGRALAGVVPSGVLARVRPVPARLLRAAWERTDFPPVEAFCGRVDVFHGTNFVLPPVRRAKGVVTVHDLSYLRYPETVSADSLRYRRLVPRSIRRAAVVCTDSAAVADEVAAEYGLDRESVVVTPLGVEETWFAAAAPDAGLRTRLGLPERYLLAVGTLEPRKNLGTLVSAYRRMLAADPTTPTLVLAGPAGWGPALQLDSMPAGTVMTTGYLDQPTLQRVVAGASCLAFPSRYEGFGLPPLEALACGVAVVASDLPVTREVLGTHAAFVPVGDVDALAAACLLALTQPSDQAGSDARRAYARRWTWQRCAEQTRVAYRQALH